MVLKTPFHAFENKKNPNQVTQNNPQALLHFLLGTVFFLPNIPTLYFKF